MKHKLREKMRSIFKNMPIPLIIVFIFGINGVILFGAVFMCFPNMFGNGTLKYNNERYVPMWEYLTPIEENEGIEVKVSLHGALGQYQAVLYEMEETSVIFVEYLDEFYIKENTEFPSYEKVENIEKVKIEITGANGTVYEQMNDFFLTEERIANLMEDVKTFDQKKQQIKSKNMEYIANVYFYYKDCPLTNSPFQVLETVEGVIGLYVWEDGEIMYVPLTDQDWFQSKNGL